MVKGIILFMIAILLIGLVLYSTFCWAPGQGSKREEQEDD